MARPQDFATLYRAFDEPVTDVDCGLKCGPYNERGVPFCCDPRHAIPTAYREEWAFLQAHTDLWRLWQDEDEGETRRIWRETPSYQVPIVCKGVAFCQRPFRSVVCRAFPFFPYVSRQNELWGLSYYWQYEDRCWVLSHLHRVRPAFVQAALDAYRQLFAWYPQERAAFRHHTQVMDGGCPCCIGTVSFIWWTRARKAWSGWTRPRCPSTGCIGGPRPCPFPMRNETPRLAF